jgi:hypothetical protein
MLGVPAAASRWSRLASARGSLCPRSLNPSDNAPRNHSECANRSGHRYCYITEGYTCNITYTHFARARHCGETVPLGKQPGRMIQPVSQPAQVHRTMQPWQGNAACIACAAFVVCCMLSGGALRDLIQHCLSASVCSREQSNATSCSIQHTRTLPRNQPFHQCSYLHTRYNPPGPQQLATVWLTPRARSDAAPVLVVRHILLPQELDIRAQKAHGA